MPGKNTAKLSHTGNTPGWHNVVNSMKAFIDLREKKLSVYSSQPLDII